MSKSYYKNLLRFWTCKNKHGNWYNKLFRRKCKKVLTSSDELSDANFPQQKEVVESWNIQDARAFWKPNKDKIRSYKQIKD